MAIHTIDPNDIIKKIQQQILSLDDSIVTAIDAEAIPDIQRCIQLFQAKLKNSHVSVCSAIYIWKVKCVPSVFRDVWNSRRDLYKSTEEKNRKHFGILTSGKDGDDGKPLKFALTPLNDEWLPLSSNESTMEECVLYIGKRDNGKIIDRLKEHFSANPATGSLKLSGSQMKPGKMNKQQKDFFLSFQEEDKALISRLGISQITCDVIFLSCSSSDKSSLLEAILRNALNPILGKK